jgi:hypothetical protein
MRDSAASVEAPDGIALGVLLGAGSYGRVYKGEGLGGGGWGLWEIVRGARLGEVVVFHTLLVQPGWRLTCW